MFESGCAWYDWVLSWLGRLRQLLKILDICFLTVGYPVEMSSFGRALHHWCKSPILRRPELSSDWWDLMVKPLAWCACSSLNQENEGLFLGQMSSSVRYIHFGVKSWQRGTGGPEWSRDWLTSGFYQFLDNLTIKLCY